MLIKTVRSDGVKSTCSTSDIFLYTIRYLSRESIFLPSVGSLPWTGRGFECVFFQEQCSTAGVVVSVVVRLFLPTGRCFGSYRSRVSEWAVYRLTENARIVTRPNPLTYT